MSRLFTVTSGLFAVTNALAFALATSVGAQPTRTEIPNSPKPGLPSKAGTAPDMAHPEKWGAWLVQRS